MELIVPDASVIIKWVLRNDEADGEKAFAILSGWLEGKYEIFLPSLWFFEVGNIISRREPRLAGAIMKRLLDLEFYEVKMTEPLLNLALDLAIDRKATFYDAAYHAIAIQEKGIFVTADGDYFDRANDKGSIQLLESFM